MRVVVDNIHKQEVGRHATSAHGSGDCGRCGDEFPHRTERVDDGTNSLKFVCRVIFPVRAPQPSDVKCNERSQVSKGKFDIDDDVTVEGGWSECESALVYYKL